MLTKQKNNILSEIEKIRNEKNIKLKNNQNNKNKFLSKKNIIENIKTENENLEKEYEKIKDDYQKILEMEKLLDESHNVSKMFEEENKELKQEIDRLNYRNNFKL